MASAYEMYRTPAASTGGAAFSVFGGALSRQADDDTSRMGMNAPAQSSRRPPRPQGFVIFVVFVTFVPERDDL
jgi:hypothetical protein